MKHELAELEWVKHSFRELSLDLGKMLEHGISFRGVCSRRAEQRAVGEREVHISFRFSFYMQECQGQGCLLLPLSEASSMAAYLLALGERGARLARGIEAPDRTMKESMLLLGEIISGSVGRAAKQRLSGGLRVEFGGCQGVRADVRPAFDIVEGDQLIVGRARARLGSSKAFHSILMLPVLRNTALVETS